jgi:hypothetical protein
MVEINKSLIDNYYEGITLMKSLRYRHEPIKLTNNKDMLINGLAYPEVKIYREKDNTIIEIIVPKIQTENTGSFFFPKKTIRDFWIFMRPGSRLFIDGELKSIFLIDNKYKAKSQVQFIKGDGNNIYCFERGIALISGQILQLITTCASIECKFEVELDLFEGLNR